MGRYQIISPKDLNRRKSERIKARVAKIAFCILLLAIGFSIGCYMPQKDAKEMQNASRNL